MKIVTADQMRALDRAAIEKEKIPSLTLMERAGASVATRAKELLGKKKGLVVIVAGKGNNGGDGLVAARHLIADGFDVRVIVLARASDLSADSKANFELLVPLTTHVICVSDTAELSTHIPFIASGALVIDAVLGTGLSDRVKGLYALAIDAMNTSSRPVISIDIPSGLSSDDGRVLGTAVRASVTVTLGLPKRGMFMNDGVNLCGKIFVADIGLPANEIEKIKASLEMIEPSMFAKYLIERDPSSHKGDYGHVAVFAGALGHLGAGYLTSLAALRSGAGLVTFALPEKAFTRFDARYPEIMCDAIPDDGAARFHPKGLDKAFETANGKSVVAIGPAIGTEKTTREFLNSFVKKVAAPIVIDADGLNLLDIDSVRTRNKPTVLTPHPGEMARLLNTKTENIQLDRIKAATELAAKTGAYVILKGHDTIVAAPDGWAAINPTGNAGMATAGMGDALTGIVASFIAQKMPVKEACLAAVYVHGLAGDIAAESLTERALITSDVIGMLGKAMNTIGLE